MSKITGIVLILCLFNLAHGGVTSLVPNFVKNAAAGMVPDEVTKLIYKIPSDEVVAAKRFALEADMGVDPERIEYSRNELFRILMKSANFGNQNVSLNQNMQQNIQYVPVQQNLAPPKPGYIQSTINSALNTAAQTVQPKFSVALAPSISFGHQ